MSPGPQMNQPLSNSQMRDVEALLHPATNLASHRIRAGVLERAKGVHVWDRSGERTSRDWRDFGAPAWATATTS